jgi:putative iron-dependent peroxidase
MLERMFIGDPPGLHDRLLDFSTPQTGSTYFAPSAAMLAALDDVADADAEPAPPSDDPSRNGPSDPGPSPVPDPDPGPGPGLGIGSLKTLGD